MTGVVFGLMMQSMSAPTPDGGQMPMMAMIGAVVGSPTVAAGWAYHLLNSATPIFAPLLMPPMRVVAMDSLVGHIMFGLTLGGVYLGVARPKPALA